MITTLSHDLVHATVTQNAQAHCVLWDGKLRSDVHLGLCNQAQLVGLDEAVAGDDCAGLVDLHQHIDLLQTGLYGEHAAHRDAAYLQAHMDMVTGPVR